MFNAKFEGFLSKHLKVDEYDFMSKAALPSNLGMFFVNSSNSKEITINALRNAYVDEVTTAATCQKEEILFKLNVGELERDIFKLEQEMMLLELTEKRLTDEYLANFIFKPLDAAADFAKSNYEAATEEAEHLRIPYEQGIIPSWEYLAALDRKACAEVLALKATNDLAQRHIEIDGQKRQLQSQQADLARRIMVTRKIVSSYEYAAGHDANVISHTYAGAFVEEGDPILTLVV
ncbi:hypothetical protein D3C80_913360 [compost metagenome]|uniref:hypothetical protein n=1 Tax=Agrobacterium tumefaciens TaxID=358 RepID=UPI000FBA1F64|nr:hypothetical protein [Agrobacterium tumefaciens]MBP2572392.1 hypothetical protein [Agrobacterium tumefaciens]